MQELINEVLERADGTETLAANIERLIRRAEDLSRDGYEDEADRVLEAAEMLLPHLELFAANDDEEAVAVLDAEAEQLGAEIIRVAPVHDAPPPDETLLLSSLLTGRLRKLS